MGLAVKKTGEQSVIFENRPCVTSWAAVAGPMEGEGPLKRAYDMIMEDSLFDQDSWEKAEQKMMQYSIELALKKADRLPWEMDYLLGGDLLNQIVTANFSARVFGVPFFGLYGACSTLAEGMILAGILVDGGYGDSVGAASCSHHDTAERQLRFPTEMGVQRSQTAQWTVTGSGAYLIQSGESSGGSGVRMTHATVGKVVDYGVKNASDMGSAMAPAARDTIRAHLEDTGRSVADYDYIVTGDLGYRGFEALKALMAEAGLPANNLADCGMYVYDGGQDTHSGASGCGCSAIVMGPRFFAEMSRWPRKKLLFAGTGALLSPLTSFQGESIPGIAHAIAFEWTDGEGGRRILK
jgi:stage V sporulation protein AD